MENKSSLLEYLKRSKPKRRQLISFANEIFDNILQQESKNNKSTKSQTRENQSALRNNKAKKILLTPLTDKKPQIRVFSCHNNLSYN